MELYIDARGGMAGDMFAAALIPAGADQLQMIEAMELAAAKIGRSSIKALKTNDDAMRLLIDIEHHHAHLSGHKAQHLLDDICQELNISGIYKKFASDAQNILIKAEIKAHRNNTFLTDQIHHHHHHHGHEHHQ